MKKFFLPIAMLVMALLACSQDSAQPGTWSPPKDLSGFSGYAWGTSIEFVTDHMEVEEYELVAATCTKISYRGSLLDEDLIIVYGFDYGRLSAGIWIFDDVDYDSFWRVNEFLQEVYNVKTEPTVRFGFAEAEMFPRGTNAHIVHNLDIEDDRHEVHYYFRSGEE